MNISPTDGLLPGARFNLYTPPEAPPTAELNDDGLGAGRGGAPSGTGGFFPTASEYFLGWAICDAASWKIEGVFMICSKTFWGCSRVVVMATILGRTDETTAVAAIAVVATVEVLVAMTTYEDGLAGMGSRELYFMLACVDDVCGLPTLAGTLPTTAVALAMVTAADDRGWELDLVRCCSGARAGAVAAKADFGTGAVSLIMEDDDEEVTEVGGVSWLLLFVNNCRTALDFTAVATAG